MAAAVPAIVAAAKVASVAYGVYNVLEGIKNGNLMQAVVGGVSAYFGMQGLGAATGTQTAASAGGSVGVANPGAALNGALGEGAATVGGTVGGAIEGGAMGAMTQGFGANLAEAAGTNLLTDGATNLATEGLQFGAQSAGGALSGAAPSMFGGIGVDAASQSAFNLSSGAADMMPNLVSSGSSDIVTDTLANASTDVGAGAGAGAGNSGGFLDRAKELGTDAMGFAKENPELLKVGGQMLSGYAKGKQEEEMLERMMKEREAERSRRGAAAGNASFLR